MSADAAIAAAPVTANALRGEAELRLGAERWRLRPSFTALVAAEAELGPLFALIERAAAGELRLTELAALFWHCLDPRPATLTRSAFSEGLAGQGLASATPVLRVLLGQILQGR